MSGELSAEAWHQIALEERAHQLRLAMYRTPGFLERLSEGYEAAERGDVVSLDEVEREIARLDAEIPDREA